MSQDVTSVENHRDGFALVPDPDEKNPGIALIIEARGADPVAICTCPTWYQREKRRRCGHVDRLRELARELRSQWGGRPFADVIDTTFWGRLARILHAENPQAAESAPITVAEGGYRISASSGATLVRVIGTASEARRLEDRCDVGTARTHQRARLLFRMRDMQTTASEAALNQAGTKTQRQVFESSLWHRLAYHCVREYHDTGDFTPVVDLASGSPWLVFAKEGAPLLRVRLPPSSLESVLKLLAERIPDSAVRAIPLKSLLAVKPQTRLDLDVRPGIEILQAMGEVLILTSPSLHPFRYGRLLFLPQVGVLAEREVPGAERKFIAPVAMQLAKSRLDTITLEADEPVAAMPEALKVFREYDSIDIAAGALAERSGDDERRRYWLSVRYAVGQGTVSLSELMQAREERRTSVDVEGGWLDLTAPAFSDLDRLQARTDATLRDGDRVALSAIELLRLGAPLASPVRVDEASGDDRARVARLLEGRPSRPLVPPSGLASALRPYQELGLEWLGFLWEHGLAGLLCDEMGLGKTHQTMAFLMALREQMSVSGPFLVVCPTSVVSHWRDKLQVHAPGLDVQVHHGQERRAAALAPGAATVTSYGILWRDIELFAQTDWAVSVFDEVQQIKNSGTRAHQAALRLKSTMRLGLTGTPIENHLGELKALFDFVLPGHLGTDEGFNRRYGGGPGAPPRRLDELQRLLRPFVLRRLKSAVLSELPERTEDLRACPLSAEQSVLYREALSERGPKLLESIRSAAEPVPYIHIFALLNILKRICDHPALALGREADYRQFSSGKWDLFCELLDESLESGQKVIVFTQFLGMIRMFEAYLREQKIGFATLVGASRDRGRLVDRFNTDPDCRVFLASLKAGGTGIDLVGGSVVIHYDRWWNAAREDQATDRAHRIGQKRAVQVFKLVTEGTLEERISAIIDRKRELAADVLHADEPGLSKVFTREELAELLEPPGLLSDR